ncbi:hypothetical protein [Pseudomonas plecoglossicida]|uniref:hypothetical protein n=1 Tax=Pseudomonas plecoglossicida TaxID=70775 RepID=UPI0015E3F3DE|nr:hypothetical protein [Pseudomonas plecoglossicida]MBA1322704.1 hypothetical protein [Pseudomonas plecoglossicida]
MAIGSSGRLVIEVNPDFKKDLYDVLGADGLTLKEWFLQAAREHINKRRVHDAPDVEPGRLGTNTK